MLKKSVFGTTLLSSLISERTTLKLYGTCDEVKADVARYFDISSALITRNAGTESLMELRGKLHLAKRCHPRRARPNRKDALECVVNMRRWRS